MTGGYRKMKLFSLMVALLVAGLAVVGGTWATLATVNYGVSETAKPHDLNVDISYFDSKGVEHSMGANTKEVFSDRTWCPGRTEIVYLKVKNNEAFPIDMNLELVMEENQFAGANTMTMAWLTERDLSQLKTKIAACSDWIDFCDAVGVQVANKRQQNTGVVIPDQITVLKKSKGEAEKILSGHNQNLVEANNEYYVALAIHMAESATSTEAGKTMSVKFKWQANSNEFPTTQPK